MTKTTVTDEQTLAPPSIEEDTRPTIRVRVPNGWARAVLAGLEAAVIGWAFVMLLALVGYLSVSSNAWLGTASLADARAIGADAWTALLGGSIIAEQSELHIIPTGATVLVILALRALLIPCKGFPASTHWFAVPGFAIPAVVMAATSGGHGPWWSTILGALFIPFVAAAWAVAQQTRAWPSRLTVPTWVTQGLRQGLAMTGIVAMVALVPLVTAVYAGWSRVVGIHELLLTRTVLEDVLIVTGQLLFAPTATFWALSWLAGPGFFLGPDALHSPTSAVVAPIPAIPLLGAVPSVTPGNWVVLTLLLLGVLVGLWWRWRSVRQSLAEQALSAGLAALVLWAALWGWGATSTLTLGSGRMALLGPSPITVASVVTCEVALVAMVTCLAVHPVTLERARMLLSRSREAASSLGAAVEAQQTGDTGRTPVGSPAEPNTAESNTAKPDTAEPNTAEPNAAGGTEVEVVEDHSELGAPDDTPTEDLSSLRTSLRSGAAVTDSEERP